MNDTAPAPRARLMTNLAVATLATTLPWLAAPGGCGDVSGLPNVDPDDTAGIDLGLGDDDDDDNSDGDTVEVGDGCAGLRSYADHKLDGKVVGCIEGGFEQRGFPFDAKPCDDLEGALSLGFGAFDSLWLDCQEREGFGDADCDSVIGKCL